MFEIEGQAFFVAVEGLEKLAVGFAKEMRADAAANVAAIFVVLDLDDFCAEVGEVRGAERAGAVLLDGEDAQAGQG